MRAIAVWALAAALAPGQAAAVGPPPSVARDGHGDILPRGAVARYGSLRLWFEEGVLAVAFAPDAKRLAVLSNRLWDDNLSVWRTADGKRLALFSIETPRGVKGLSWSPDGRSIALLGDGKVTLVDARTGRLIRWYNAPDAKAPCAAFAPRRGWLTGGYWGDQPDRPGLPRRWRVRRHFTLYDEAKSKDVRQLRGPTGEAAVFAVSDDGTLVATEERRGGLLARTGVRLWDLRSGRELRPLGGHTAAVTTLAVSPDGRTLVSGSEDGSVCVWRTDGGKEARRFGRHEGPITALAFSPDGARVASGDTTFITRVWSPATAREVGRPHPSETPYDPSNWGHGVRAIAFLEGGRSLRTLCRDTDIDQSPVVPFTLVTTRDAASGEVLRDQRADNALPLALAPGGRTVVVATKNASADRFDPPQLAARSFTGGNVLWQIKRGQPEQLWGVIISPDGKFLALDTLHYRGRPAYLIAPRYSFFAGAPILTRVYEMATGRLVHSITNGGASLAFSPDGRLLALAGRSDSDVRLVEAATGRELARLEGHRDDPGCGVFSPDGRRLYTGGADRTVLAWDVARHASAVPSGRPLSTRALDRMWLGLAAADPATAASAVRALAASPRSSLPMLRARLRPVTADIGKVIDGAVRDLGSDTFARRRRGLDTLVQLRPLAEGALRKALEKAPDVETRQRISRILAGLDHGPTPDRLRALRATTALERMGTAEARRLLADLARGAAGATLTEEAAASLRRLDARR